jgi:dipeptidyl-peptidase-4
MRVVRGSVLVIAAVTLAWAAKKPVSVEDAASWRPAPAVSAVWSPDGKRFAFQEKDAIWIYDVPSGARKELVSYARLDDLAVKPPKSDIFDWQNRRVREQSYSWASSGRTLLVSRHSDVFLVDAESGQITQLTATAAEERDAKLSPDGKFVAFRQNHDLYTLDVATRKTNRLTRDGSDVILNGELDWVYPEELDLGTAFWWSPDSKSIAYMQFDVSREPVFPQVDLLGTRGRLEPQRYPKAGDPNADVRVGVIAATGGSTRWMDAGDPRDQLIARVDWLPDSNRVAIRKMNRIQNRLDLLVVDAATGNSETVLKEEDPYWVNLVDVLHFFKDGRSFLWGSERSGFRHLYLFTLNAKGKKWKPQPLTQGEWEVADLAGVDEERRLVYFLSTANSPAERQLYRVSLGGGRPEQISRMRGTHSISMNPTSSHYLDTASSLTEAARVTLHESSGKQIAVVREPDSSTGEFEILPAEIVQMRAADGTTLYARMIKPAGFEASKKYPVITIVYGGPHGQAVKDQWSGLSWEQALAHRGYVIWQLDNRGTDGRGHKFESVVYRNLGEKELEDQLAGLKHLESLGFADMSRVGMYGWSYGGFMTLYSLLNAPDKFRAGIAGAPVTDWRNYDTIYTERYMGLPADYAEAYTKSSPLGKAGELKARLMLVHNFSDDNVHFQNTMQMANALQKANKPFEMMVYPQKAHGVTGDAKKQMLQVMTRFFDEHLK